MNKLRKKILIAFFTLILIAGVGCAIWSYRNAFAEDNRVTEFDSVDMGSRPAGFTNIDYIIENARDTTLVPDPTTGYDESVYHIVEISSGSLSLLDKFSELNETDLTNADTNDDYAAFRRVVLTLNRSSAQPNEMPVDKIEYIGFSTADLNANQTNADAAISAIVNADFLYVSIDPNSVYDNANHTDIPSDVKTALNRYATTLKKPIIIDSPTKTKRDQGESFSSFNTLGKTFYENGISYNTFFWGPKDTASTLYSVADLFDRTSGSVFMPINGNIVRSNWVNTYEQVTDANGTFIYKQYDGPNPQNANTYNVARILSITASSTDATPLADKIKASSGDATPVQIVDGTAVIASETDGTPISDVNGRQAYVGTLKTVDAYKITTTNPLNNAYKTYAERPDYVVFDKIKYNKDTTVLTVDELSKYDIIILEDSLAGQPIADGSDTTTNKNDLLTFISLMYKNQHIIYSRNMIPTGNGEQSERYNAVNFNDLYDRLVDENDNRRLDSVLVCSRKEMNETYANKDADGNTEAPIAYIINKGAYRPSGSGDDSSDKFRVLEIQPAYPVDMALAAEINKIIMAQNAVNDPTATKWVAEPSRFGNVLYGQKNGYSYFFNLDRTTNNTPGENFSADEISFDGNISLSAMKDADGNITPAGQAIIADPNNLGRICDYYAWELTPAKVLHIIEQTTEFAEYPADKIEIIHMSSTQFQSSRVSLLDNYDLIYFGGDNSGIKDLEFFRANPSGREGGHNSTSHNIGASNATYYNMYYHNGDIYEYTDRVPNGYVANGYGVLYGNDITYDKLVELKDYVDAGMPVVVTKQLTDAYQDVVTRRGSNTQYQQHTLDPDSNVVKFLDTYYDGHVGEGKTSNIIFGFNSQDTVRIPNQTRLGGKYSEEAKSGVTVFGGDAVEDVNGNQYTSTSTVSEKDLVKLVTNSQYRPKFKMTRFPKSYDGSTLATKRDTSLNSKTLSYAFDMIGDASDVTFYLYIDDNVDSKFTEDEIVTSCEGTAGKFSYTVDDDFSGALYLQVTAKRTNGTKSSWRQMCKINSTEKEQIDILQILPENMYTVTGQESKVTLYFCTECQTASNVFKGNHYCWNGKYSKNVLQAQHNNAFDESNPSNVGLTAPTVQNGIISRDPATKVTTGDKTYTYVGNNLGVHVHDFGIFDYDAGNTQFCTTGQDDLTDNLADEIENDYDFNVNIMSTREFETMISGVESMYAASTDPIVTLRDRYAQQRSKYEAFYKEMTMLIDEDVTYVPSALYDLRRRVGESSGAGASVIDTLRAELRNFYTTAGISEPSGAASMTSDALLSDIESKLGLSAASYTSFSDMLGRYDLTITDHINFEREMIALGSDIPTITEYSHAQKDMNDFCDEILNAINTQSGFTSSGWKTNSIGYLTDEIQYWKTHHNYYDFYSICGDAAQNGPTITGHSQRVATEFSGYYMPWRDSMIYKKYFYDKYMEAKVKEAVDDNGKSLLNSVYSIIIMGPANHFGMDDLNKTGTDAIKRYAENEGKVLLYHDTIDSAKIPSTTGDYSINLVKELRETFGMDARHLVAGANDSDKELISSRTFDVKYGKSTFTIPVAQEAHLQYKYNLTFNPPSNASKIRVYVTSSAPSAVNYQYQWSPDRFANVYDISTARAISPNGGYDSNTSSITGTLNMDGNNLYSAGDSNISTTTGSGASSITFNFDINKYSYWPTGYFPTDEQYYLIVSCSENEPHLGQNRLLAENCTVIPIKSGETASVMTGVPSLTAAASRNDDGNLSGFTTESNKQKLSVCISAADLSSVLGTSITFTDTANGYTDSATFTSGTYGSDSVAKATVEFDNWKIRSGASVSYVPSGGRSSDKYYLSTLATDGTNNIRFGSSSKTLITNAISARTMAGPTGYTDNNTNKHMYKFGSYDTSAEEYTSSITRQDAIDEYTTGGGKRQSADKVGNNNKGLLTSYPFSLPDGFTITATHPQTFDLDVESSDMTVYYSLVAGHAGTVSELFAADPYDGTENYFIYQYDSVTYCGAGHMWVTGFGTNNREERMLYINVIVNSLHKSAIGTQVKLYDENATNDKIENGTANAVIKPDGLGNYTLEVKDSTVTPAFSVKALVDTNEHVTRVRAWYDLDLESEQINHPFEDPDGVVTFNHKLFYDTNGGTYDRDNDGVDDTIPAATASELAEFTVNPVNINNDAKFNVADMKLKQEYFDAYDGMHTYIVVCVTTERKGKVYNTYRKIRINLKPYMFDLT